MPSSADQVRLEAFVSQLWAELYKIPTPIETAKFLTSPPDVRRKMTRDCKNRARPLLEMITEIESWKK